MASISALESGFEHFPLIEAAPVAILMTDPQGQITLVNREAESLFGWRRAELLGRRIEMLVPERARGRHPRLRASYLQGPQSRRMGLGKELYALHKNGTEIPVEIGLRPLETPDGTFVLSTIVDISERIRNERATARLAAIVRYSHVAMIAMTTNGIVTDWNPAAQTLYGYSAEEMIGQSVLILVPEELRSEAQGIIERVRRGETVDILETVRQRKSGERVPVSLTVSPIEGPDRRVVGITSITRDTSQRIALEAQIEHAHEKLAERAERLQQANLALEQSNSDLQQFAYVASHDLQAPLRRVRSFLRLLRAEHADRLDAQAQDWIQHSLDSVERLQILIQDLLSYARVDSRGEPFERVDLARVVDDTKRTLETSITESEASVTRDELPVVLGDAAQLASVMENLIGNALKYRSHARPLIHVGVESEPDHWRFSVRDNGIGIDPQFHEEAFEIFRRLHTENEYPGTGIGLAICQRAIKRHGGRLWIESATGRGSIFYFTLPKR